MMTVGVANLPLAHLGSQVAKARRVVERLVAREVEAAAEVERLREQKSPDQLGAANGDLAAATRIKEINEQLWRQQLRMEDLAEARRAAEAMATEAESRLARARDLSRADKIERLAILLKEAATSIDQAMHELSRRFAAHERLVGQISELDPELGALFAELHRYRRPGRLAAVYHELHPRHLPLGQMVGLGRGQSFASCEPLAEIARAVEALRAQAEEPVRAPEPAEASGAADLGGVEVEELAT